MRMSEDIFQPVCERPQYGTILTRIVLWTCVFACDKVLIAVLCRVCREKLMHYDEYHCAARFACVSLNSFFKQMYVNIRVIFQS